MDGLSTVTQKGQIVIPQNIRLLLNFKPSTRVYFEVKDDAVMIKPALTINQAMGMIKTKKRATQEDYDRAIRDAVVAKFSKHK